MNVKEKIKNQTIESIVCAAAVETFGEEPQMRQAVEEMAELIVAINHKIRGRESNIPEEIADVEIMLEQLKIIEGCDAEVERIKRLKIERLQRRMEE